jgi:hypothetical protein
MVAHVFNHSYLRGGDRRIMVQGQARPEVGEIMVPCLKNKLDVLANTCDPTYVIGGILVHPYSRQRSGLIKIKHLKNY